ncbi:MAG: hypothetical protein IPF98_25235 [Gemmatimonadetes bacterium]|nr:hypothetical protein [Gemmatimonadota bacterium]
MTARMAQLFSRSVAFPSRCLGHVAERGKEFGEPLCPLIQRQPSQLRFRLFGDIGPTFPEEVNDSVAPGALTPALSFRPSHTRGEETLADLGKEKGRRPGPDPARISRWISDDALLYFLLPLR